MCTKIYILKKFSNIVSAIGFLFYLYHGRAGFVTSGDKHFSLPGIHSARSRYDALPVGVFPEDFPTLWVYPYYFTPGLSISTPP